MHDFDAIVIGSGAGGLTAAVALANAGKKVIVLEQHYVPGGWCHSFTIGGHRFSPGVHYIGELQPGGRVRRIYEGLGVANDVPFFEINPNGLDHVRVAGERFDIPRGRAALADRLKSRFPAEAAGIDRYLTIVQKIGDELGRVIDLDGDNDKNFLFHSPTVLRYGMLSVPAVYKACGIRDPLLMAFLGAQAGDYGLAPADASMAIHASVVSHYFDGGYYPKGGGFSIPRAFTRALKRAGGELRLKARVEKILIEDGRAIGVRLAGGEELRAPYVISNADPAVTFGRLIDKEHLSMKLKLRLRFTSWSVSSVSLFAAADFDARGEGFDSGNYWCYDSTDIDGIYRLGETEDAHRLRDFPGFFTTFTTLKDPTKLHGAHTMEAFSFVPASVFAQWRDTKTGERGPEYEKFKAEMTGKMIDTVGKLIPNFRKRLVFAELGTPLTNTHYCESTEGNLYGTRKNRLQIGPFGYSVRTEIRGLKLCGASTLGHGVLGATMSGLIAAASVLKCPIREMLTAKGQQVVIRPSEPDAEDPKKAQPAGEPSFDRERTRSASASSPATAAPSPSAPPT